MTIPSSVLISVTASAPASLNGAGNLDDAVGVGAELGPPWSAAALDRVDDLGGQIGIVGEDAAATLQVGARQVDLDGDDVARRVGQQLGGASIVVDRSSPDADDDTCAGGDERGQVVSKPRLDSGTLQARPR